MCFYKLPEPPICFYKLPEPSMSFCRLPWVQWIIKRILNTKLTTNYAQRSANNWSCLKWKRLGLVISQKLRPDIEVASWRLVHSSWRRSAWDSWLRHSSAGPAALQPSACQVTLNLLMNTDAHPACMPDRKQYNCISHGQKWILYSSSLGQA